MKNFLAILLMLALCGAVSLRAAGRGDEVVVVYNTRVPESKDIAEHYAKVRQVPESQVFGFDMPTRETINRGEFHQQIENPLSKVLVEHGLLHFDQASVANQDGKGEQKVRKVTSAKIRYLVLCYGVPLVIGKDPTLKEEGEEKLRPELRHNGAAIDNELACLPLIEQHYMRAGAIGNPFFGCTNAATMHPTNNLLIVARLDGPSAAIARGLVDKAVQAEKDGLWGRAYFDLRGIHSGNYKLGEDWLRGASEVCRQMGFETVVDENAGTFPVSFPLSQVAFYSGWYEESITGPFTRPTVEFMPGAFAYHLHSISAASLRTTTRQWVGPFLAKGVTATMGCVDEPYLAGTPDMAIFYARFVYSGFTFGEAAYASQALLSWQATVVGDPLYRPFAKGPQEQVAELEQSHSKLLEWYYVRAGNFKMINGTPTNEIVSAFEKLPLTKTSAVLSEKLAELYQQQGRTDSSVELLQSALKLDPTPQQRVRLMLNLGTRLLALGRNQESYDVYKEFLKACPDYPDNATIYRQLAELAEKLGRKEEAANFQHQIDSLGSSQSKLSKQPALRPGI
jgi:uncharacterized protein (TIGR03790 family)